MANATEDLTDPEGGAWTNNGDAWDGDTGDAASSSTDDQQTYGSVDDTDPFSAIGDGDTIQGIEVLLYADGDGDDYVTVELYKPSDTGYITQTYDVTPDGTPDWTNDIAGGAANTWGESWSPASDIKDGDFGVRLTYHNVTKSNTINVYAVRIRVTYATVSTTTITKTSVIRWMKEQQTDKTSSIRWQKDQQIDKTSGMRWAIATVMDKSSAIRWLVRTVVDKTSSIRWRKDQTIDKTCAIRWAAEPGEGGQGTPAGDSKHRTGARTVHK